MTVLAIIVVAFIALAFSESLLKKLYIRTIEASPPEIRGDEKIITYPLA